MLALLLASITFLAGIENTGNKVFKFLYEFYYFVYVLFKFYYFYYFLVIQINNIFILSSLERWRGSLHIQAKRILGGKFNDLVGWITVIANHSLLLPLKY